MPLRKGEDMGKLFAPIKDLVGAVYDVLFDAATKVWSLLKPVVLIGLLFDLVTGQLGWITNILTYYDKLLTFTGGAHWLIILVIGLLAVNWFATTKK